MMMEILVSGLISLVIGFACGWVAYSKWGAKVQAIGTTISADLKK
jgi:hypothetical protein